MTRFGTKLTFRTASTLGAVGGMLLALAAAPAVASAQTTTAAVDDKTGPVSFANGAALSVSTDGQKPATVITETQRSPLQAGVSRLGQDRSVVPNPDKSGEKEILPNYELHFGTFGKPSPFPDEITSAEHNVAASLADTHVPSAVAESSYSLLDNTRGGKTPLDNAIVVLQSAKSTVDCATTDKTTGSSEAKKLWVRDKQDKLTPVDLPAEGKQATVTEARAGAPITVEKADKTTTTSDVTVSRLTEFDKLLKQEQWRDGDLTVAAGWQVDVVTHVRDADGKNLRDVSTKAVLGGVSCSLPKDFVPVAAGGGDQPGVPTKIPAGAVAASTDEPQPTALGFGLLGGGVVLAAAAVTVLRRRRPAPAQVAAAPAATETE